MINLLPPGEKQKLLLERKEKLVKIWGFVISVALICLMLVLLSVKFYILSEADSQKEILNRAEQENQVPGFADMNKTIQKYNLILSQVESFYNKEIYFSHALEIITNIPSTKGLHMNNFSLNRNKDGVISASISGVSSTRDDLLVFRENINNNKTIIEPYFSPESWVNQKNTNFLLTFKINEK